MTTEERAARQAARERRAAQEREDKMLVAEAARAVLRDDRSTPAQRLTAIAILDQAEHYYIVHYVLHNAGKELTNFAEALRQTTADTTDTAT